MTGLWGRSSGDLALTWLALARCPPADAHHAGGVILAGGLLGVTGVVRQLAEGASVLRGADAEEAARRCRLHTRSAILALHQVTLWQVNCAVQPGPAQAAGAAVSGKQRCWGLALQAHTGMAEMGGEWAESVRHSPPPTHSKGASREPHTPRSMPGCDLGTAVPPSLLG